MDVVVTNPSRSSTASSADTFTYTNGQLSITGTPGQPFIFDASAGDGSITITADGQAPVTYAAGQYGSYVYNADGSTGTVKVIGSPSGNVANFYSNDAQVPSNGYGYILFAADASSNPETAQLTNAAAGYTLTVSSPGEAFFFGHAGDTANFFALTPALNDAFYAWAAHPNFGGQPVAELTGGGAFHDYAIGFGADIATASSARLNAYFFTAANQGLPGSDTFYSWAAHANFGGQPVAEMNDGSSVSPYNILAVGFATSGAFSAKDTDTAIFYAPAGPTVSVDNPVAKLSWDSGQSFASGFQSATILGRGQGDPLGEFRTDYYFTPTAAELLTWYGQEAIVGQ